MTQKQYKILLDLYLEYNEAFISLPASIQDKYYDILLGNAKYSDAR